MLAETIIHNAKIATNGVPSFVDAIAIERGKVTAVGTSDEILGLCGPPTDMISRGWQLCGGEIARRLRQFIE
jgi:predicted amidohydrolase YtcJ